MTIGTSLLLLAAGAILRFAVTADVSGIELATVGTILMVIGVIGLVIGLFLLSRPAPVERTVARDYPRDYRHPGDAY